MTTSTLTRPSVRLPHGRALELTRELQDHDRRLASDHIMVLAYRNPSFTTILWASTDLADESVIHLVAGTDGNGNLASLPQGCDFEVTNPRNLAVFVDPEFDKPQRIDLARVRAWVQEHVTDASKKVVA